jgi:hypothetical protein
MSIQRLVSILVTGIYLLIAYFGGKNVAGFRDILGISLVLGLPCIWFGDELGGMVGYLGHARITSTTPGSVVRFVGWLLLLFLPVLGYILSKYAVGN